MNISHMHCGFREVKFAADSSQTNMTFSGYGAVFDNVDAGGDVIRRGAFSETIAEAKKTGRYPAMLEQHGGMGMSAADLTPVGIWLDMSEDEIGLKVEGKFADTSRGRDLYTLMKMTPRPAIDGLSIGFRPRDYEMRAKPEDPRRTLKKVHLIEISPVTFPMNSKARVANVKSGELTERDFERFLTQDAGMSRSEARIVINHGFKSLLSMQDAGGELSEIASMIERNTQILKN